MKGMNIIVVVGVVTLVSQAAAFGSNCGGKPVDTRSGRVLPQETPENFKAAFFGDQGTGHNPRGVLEAIKDWGAEMVVHVGDFDYHSDPDEFFGLVDSVFEADFPYFATIGNHDLDDWDGYEEGLVDRLNRIEDAECWGEYGVNMACNYKGLLFVLSGVGTKGRDHEEFIDKTFQQETSIWRMCQWHKNQHLYQIGGKEDETGYGVYDICRVHGAVVSTGHEHSYSRTKLMSDFASQSIANVTADDTNLTIVPGETIAWVQGLGGYDIRDVENNANENPWWAAWAASDNGVDYGFVACEFYVQGDPGRADCHFTDLSGKLWDNFTMHSSLETGVAASQPFCPTRAESQVVHPDDEQAARRSHEGRRLVLAGGPTPFATVLTFRDLSVPVLKMIGKVHLQLHGGATSTGRTTLRIRLGVPGAAPSTRSVMWELTDAPGGEVWVSPNLRPLLEEVLLPSGGVLGSVVQVYVDGIGARLEVSSVHKSKCLSPSIYFGLSGC
mmetsp:Transcript_2260/g.6270  ORF Transcript_2260/g.6270 Transcript_2260/m.6270 type:complete len:498 (+) Transcript_2260:59-1552(+)|eukprot:CAMPEP_0119119958 /NCGR_PEP_ID=MMETSP1310-20130426/1221_1 /TAXON_ID=464262 /ORGANISM="Genus nov. species nov., Strain RCC2339" /LENGTH=497 /DNA_ID=CAMNT_0007109417 /DNA_START=59 /DNA_END=1549 /DNA_ORIENTATION=+